MINQLQQLELLRALLWSVLEVLPLLMASTGTPGCEDTGCHIPCSLLPSFHLVLWDKARGKGGRQLAGTHWRRRCAEGQRKPLLSYECCASCFTGDDTSAHYFQSSFFICEQFCTPVSCWMLQCLCNYFLSQHSLLVQFVSTHVGCITNYPFLHLFKVRSAAKTFSQSRK